MTPHRRSTLIATVLATAVIVLLLVGLIIAWLVTEPALAPGASAPPASRSLQSSSSRIYAAGTKAGSELRALIHAQKALRGKPLFVNQKTKLLRNNTSAICRLASAQGFDCTVYAPRRKGHAYYSVLKNGRVEDAGGGGGGGKAVRD